MKSERVKRVFVCFYEVGAGAQVSNYWMGPIMSALERMEGVEPIPVRADAFSPALGTAYGRVNDEAWKRDGLVEMSNGILGQVREAHAQGGVDLFIGCLTAGQILPETVEEIRRLGVTAVNFFCDNVNDFYLVEPIAHAFDLSWIAEACATDKYASRGLPYIQLPMAADPDYHRVVSGVSEDLGVTFVGSLHAPRQALFGEAIHRGLPLQCMATNAAALRAEQALSRSTRAVRAVKSTVGNFARRGLASGLNGVLTDLERLRYPLPLDRVVDGPSDAELPAIFARSQVSVGTNRIWERGDLGFLRVPYKYYPRLRDFEAVMHGACYLTEHCDELESLFDIGEEIETYRTAEELVDKADRLVRDPERRARMRRNARRAAEERHSWRSRFERLFQEIW